MKIRITKLNKDLVDIFYKTFSIEDDFKVNDKISFYEKKEIFEWIGNTKDNLFFIVTVDNRFAGFCFAKVISFHWAIIDAFYIKPEYRRLGLATKLQRFLEKKLREKKIKYASRTPRSNNTKLHNFLEKTGYIKRQNYTWFDKFL